MKDINIKHLNMNMLKLFSSYFKFSALNTLETFE